MRHLVMQYNATETALKFHRSMATVRGMRGPRGCGKSVASIQELIKLMRCQEPFHGVRETRMVIIRNTYPELRSTTIKTWEDWMSPELFPVVYGSPVTCQVEFPLDDGTRVKSEVMFLSMDKVKDIRKLKSLEATWVYINEACEVPHEVLDMALLSVGRYPSKARGGPTRSGVIMDTNPPDEDHWWYETFEILKPDGYEQFVYEPAMFLEGDLDLRPNPNADYIHLQSLGYEYWRRAAEGKGRQWILAMVCGMYATTAQGKPVYPEYKDNFHFSPEPLEVYSGIPIFTGWDLLVTALQPALVVCQMTPRGQLRVLSELVGHDMGIRQFTTDAVVPMLSQKYPGIPILGTGDPAGSVRSGTNEQTCYDVLREFGFKITPAISNAFMTRRESVAKYLLKQVDGQPGLLLDPSCQILRKGFLGKYCYERVQVTGEATFKPEPNKRSVYSHPHDALQYACLGLMGPTPDEKNLRRRAKKKRVLTANPKGWA